MKHFQSLPEDLQKVIRLLPNHRERMKRITLSVTISLTLFASSNVTAQERETPHILAVTEKSPITQRSERLPNSGEATEFVDLVLKGSGLSHQLKFVPWRRGYHLARSTENVLIYPLARTPSREKHFQWVGKIIPIDYYLFKLKRRNDVKVTSLESSKGYRIGVVNYHAHHEFLISSGFTNLQAVNSNSQNLKKLLLDRIDLFPISLGGASALCKNIDVTCDQLEPVLKLESISGGLYMAYGLKTSPTIVKSTQDSFLKQIHNGQYEKIFKHRLNSALNARKNWNIEFQ